MLTTMREMFDSVFNHDEVLDLAREVGAVERLRAIHPADLCLALTHCAIGDETRSIATARRAFFTLTGFMPEESSFFDRFGPGSVALMKWLFEGALVSATREKREVLAAALKGTGLIDIEAIDGSQMTLPASAADVLPSTNDEHGGIKLTATLSVLLQSMTSVALCDAKTHDRKALRLDRWLHNRLFLIDRGYAAHKLWADIEDRKRFFLTPLKSSAMPTIQTVRSGVGKAHLGRPLSGALRYWGEVDIDAAFAVRKRGHRVFRVVRVTIWQDLADGGAEAVHLWFATNLPPEMFSAQQLTTICRLRWEVDSSEQ